MMWKPQNTGATVGCRSFGIVFMPGTDSSPEKLWKSNTLSALARLSWTQLRCCAWSAMVNRFQPVLPLLKLPSAAISLSGW